MFIFLLLLLLFNFTRESKMKGNIKKKQHTNQTVAVHRAHFCPCAGHLPVSGPIPGGHGLLASSGLSYR